MLERKPDARRHRCQNPALLANKEPPEAFDPFLVQGADPEVVAQVGVVYRQSCQRLPAAGSAINRLLIRQEVAIRLRSGVKSQSSL